MTQFLLVFSCLIEVALRIARRSWRVQSRWIRLLDSGLQTVDWTLNRLMAIPKRRRLVSRRLVLRIA
jgi:hypothetical protein